MHEAIKEHRAIRLKGVAEALRSNNFEVHVAEDLAAARGVVLDTILPAVNPASASWGGSKTLIASGVLEALQEREGLELIVPFEPGVSREELHERRRRALLVDLFFLGTNAVTEDGRLVNLDMWGNRVGALHFGPNHVVVLVGANKIVPDLDEAMWRIKDYAAPVNSRALGKKTPCAKTAICMDCNSPDRICNVWTITEKSLPKQRIKVVLINEECGF